jgi:hypothetical protein
MQAQYPGRTSDCLFVVFLGHFLSHSEASKWRYIYIFRIDLLVPWWFIFFYDLIEDIDELFDIRLHLFNDRLIFFSSECFFEIFYVNLNSFNFLIGYFLLNDHMSTSMIRYFSFPYRL